MKRNILLAMVLVVMLVSIGGCLVGWEGDGRGGRGGGHDDRNEGRGRDGAHDRDQRRDERR